MRTATLLVLVLLVAPLLPMGLAGTGPDPPRVTCPPVDPLLPGPPPDLERSAGPADPLRMDADGVTLMLLVEDPPDVPSAYQYIPGADGAGAGAFVHPWPTERDIVTLGVYQGAPGDRVRVPLLIAENLPVHDIEGLVAQLAADEVGPLANTADLALRMLLPDTGTFEPLGTDAYADRAPVMLWPVHRTLPDGEVWLGFARTHEGNALPYDDGATTIDQFCRRTQVSLVARDSVGTEHVAGMYLVDELRSQGPSGASQGNWTGSQTLTVGATAGGVDVPLAWFHAGEDFTGPATGYAESSQHDLTFGVVLDDGPRPLLGVRSTATHGAPPDAEHRMLSIGVYDTQDGYHPQVGLRSHFEELPSRDWLFAWSGAGPGAAVGDWVMDLGTFDPWGRFSPHARTTYDDSIDEVVDAQTGAVGLHDAQMMLTAGLVAADRYQPLLGSTYDGTLPLLVWVDHNAANDFAAMGPWRTSSGTFAPLGPYVPVVGTTYAPSEQAGYAVAESYRVGAYGGAYDAFVPLAGAEWAAGHTSLAWVVGHAVAAGAVPSDARLDVGVDTPATGFVPVVGATATQGETDHYAVGAWAGQGFVPLVHACVAPVTSGTVLVGAGAASEPLVAVGVAGTQPHVAVHEDCGELQP